MNRFYLQIVILLVFSINLFAQDQVVNDGDLPEAEFNVAINPINSDNIVIASIHGFGVDGNGNDITIYYTNDFGESWTKSDYHALTEGAIGSGDPVLAFDAEGNVLLVNLVGIPEGNDFKVETILSESKDGGATWELVQTIGEGFTDKPWLAVNQFSTTPNFGAIYIPVVEQQINLYSLDSTFQMVYKKENPEDGHLPSVVVKKNGDIFTSMVDISDPNNVFVQQYSPDGTFLHSTKAIDFPDYTFDMPKISERFQPCVYLAVDNSGGTYDGRLYLTYTGSEDVNTDFFNVFLIYSDDDGKTWSAPKVVHQDSQDEVNQFFSSIFVNNDGVVTMDWYDAKNYADSTRLIDFYMGISRDGGASFSEMKLTTEPSDFKEVVQSSNDFGIGEYHQMVATNSTAISFWSDGRTNDQDLNIYMAKVDLNDFTNVQQSIVSDKISMGVFTPQPAKGKVYSKLKVKETTTIKYEVYNIQGQTIRTSNWTIYPEGTHQMKVDLDFGTGVYFVKFKTQKGYFKTMKLICE